jgi:Cu/Ag efflux protein CusF
MRRVLATFAVVTILAGASWALAAEPVITATGTIKTVDMLNHSVTLTNGSTYRLARGVNLEGMKAGQKVKLTFRRSGPTPELELSAITPVEE